jgi:MFS family permease
VERKPRETPPTAESVSTAWESPKSLQFLGRWAILLRPLDSLLRYGSYRVLWVSSFFTMGATQMQLMARTWYIYELTGSPIAVGLVNLTFAIPLLLFSLYGGALADRIAKRSLMLFGAALMTIMGFGLAAIISTGNIHPWHLVVASVFQGTVNAFQGPARQAMVPELVERRFLLNAISLNAVQMNIARIGGPSIAGVLIGWVGIEAVFWLTGGMAALSFGLTVFLPAIKLAAQGPRRSVVGDMVQGLLYIKERPVILHLLLITFVVSSFGFPINFMLPIFAKDVLDVGPQGFGLLVSVIGLGALAGSLTMASLGDIKRKGLLMLVISLIFGIGIILFTLSRDFYLSLAFLTLVGVGESGRMTVNNTLIQTHAEDHMRGRVLAVLQMERGLQPLFLMPITLGAQFFGAPLAMGVSASVVVAYTLFVLLFQPSIRKLE